MFDQVRKDFQQTIEEIKEAGTYKTERVLESPQGARIQVKGKEVLNFCANNYLGLADHRRLKKAAQETIGKWGYGVSSVRFICGTMGVHKELEKTVSEFLETEDTILFAACFDANGGVFEPLLDSQSAICTDALNHASIIDGIRLTKAQRYIYKHSDMQDLEEKLKAAQGAKRIIIATDGVFSMDGDIANLPEICKLAEKYKAMVLVDDSHATGFMGKKGKGTGEYWGVTDRVDIITTTFGKALGGAMGGCVSGRKEIVELLRQKSRPYLFSNTLAPVIAGTTIEAITMLSESTKLRDTLMENTAYFRDEISKLGLDVKPGTHPIIPVMLYDEDLAGEMADALLEEGIYVIGFSYPVVPKGQARIRVQVSAAHTREDLDRCIAAFQAIGKKLDIL
ncbi:MAG: glycine C-acetyltransferase [Spirochaetia bacterium]